MKQKDNVSLLEEYLKRKNINIQELDIHSNKFELYRSNNNKLQEVCNFAVFPKQVEIEYSDTSIVNCVYVCDLLVQDFNYDSGIICKEITINQNEHLKSFDALKQFLVLQEPTIVIKLFSTKNGKDQFLEMFRLNLTAGFEKIFGLKAGYKIPRIGFNEDGTEFTFNNGILSLTNGDFKEGEFKLCNDSAISLSYCPEDVDKVSLEQSLKDCISMEKYVSTEKSIAAITIGYLISGIFRKEYKAIHNEFPFLGFEGYSGIGKTSLLNFLSRVVGYNWNSINGVCDSDYAFEVGMNSLGSRYYFVDEIQKISAKLQKYIQAAYNSGENHKGGANGRRQDIQTYRKDFSLIAAGEVLPQQEEALLNRFIICCPHKPFAVKKQVTDEEEMLKYLELSEKSPVNEQFLNTEEIKYLATRYYKPRFMCILKHKNLVNFQKFHNDASLLIEKYADESIDSRHKNNLICAITGYLILRQENNNEEEIKEIIKDYFSRLETYRRDSIMSGVIVNYILDNISEFGSWLGKVKGTPNVGPMVWVKYSENEQGLIMQVDNIIRYCKGKIENKLTNKHSKQQFVELLGIKDFQSSAIKFAKGERNISGTFIPFKVVETNEILKRIWDTTLSFQQGHVEDLRHILSGEEIDHGMYSQPIQKAMPDIVLIKLCEELEQTDENAEFFNKELYDNTSLEEENPF